MSSRTASRYGLTKTESKVLSTILGMESGNAYGVWKKSKLKHYPTVLRTLKKLHDKGFTKKLSVDGMRGETVYAPTLFGTLVSLKTNEQNNEVVEIVAENSSLFRELQKKDKDDYWALEVAESIIWDVQRKRAPRSFDDALRDELEGRINESIVEEFYNRVKGSIGWILELRDVDWIREAAVDLLNEEKKIHMERIHGMDKFKSKLVGD